MAELYEYGVAVHLYKPIIKRAVVDFAVGADWTPAGGDVTISKDGAAAANVTNLPAAITMGNTAMWDFSLTATEMQARKVRIAVADAAAKAVEDVMFEIDTYGSASAQHANNLNEAGATLTEIVAAILDEPVEGATTLRQSMRLANAANAGKVSGAATTTVTLRDLADSLNRITATVDVNGNRSAVTTNLT